MNDLTNSPNNNLDNMSFEIERKRIERNAKIKSYFHENKNYINDDDNFLDELKSFEEKTDKENEDGNKKENINGNEGKKEIEPTILNPETEIITPRDPDEVQSDPSKDNKKDSRNKKNKNQPL